MQVPHPLDTEIDEMDQTRRDMVRLFASDGTICEQERAILDRFTNHHDDIASYRRREAAADAFKRNGATDMTGRRFADAGYGLVDLEARRGRSNVVAFPTPRPEAG